MLLKTTKIIILSLLFPLFTITYAQEVEVKKPNRESAFSYSAAYTADGAINFFGGLNTGATYLGLAKIKLGFNTEEAGWWKGGSFAISFINVHGESADKKLIGDLHLISNISSCNRTSFYELWYQQIIGPVRIKIGMQEVGFAQNDISSTFCNGSYGAPMQFATNIKAPCYPSTSLGVYAQWDITDKISWSAAVYDGLPDDVRSLYNVKWSIGEDDGLIAMTEVQTNYSIISDQKASYKIGGFYSHYKNSEITHNGGAYILLEQNFSNRWAAMLMACVSPSKNENNYFLSTAVTAKPFINKRPEDKIGIGVVHAGLQHTKTGHETAIELLYHFQLNSHIYIRPDLQYVFSPAGTYDNAFAGILRVGINF